jgi:serine/threonine protein kinase
MAPEQAEPGPLGPAADVYALGLILYEMLTTRSPFDAAATPLATVLLRKHHPPRPLRQLMPEIDPKWEAAIHRCLERDPGRRFARAADVGAALRSEVPPERLRRR